MCTVKKNFLQKEKLFLQSCTTHIVKERNRHWCAKCNNKTNRLVQFSGIRIISSLSFVQGKTLLYHECTLRTITERESQFTRKFTTKQPEVKAFKQLASKIHKKQCHLTIKLLNYPRKIELHRKIKKLNKSIHSFYRYSYCTLSQAYSTRMISLAGKKETTCSLEMQLSDWCSHGIKYT